MPPTHPVLELTSFITQSLSPALAMSAIGLLAMGLHSRISILGGRVRELNREIRQSPSPQRADNIRQQVRMFIHRARVVRNALFLLYAALGLMVFTAFAIALTDLGLLSSRLPLPVVTFLAGLASMLAAVIFEAREVTLNLRTLKLDTDFALGPDPHEGGG